MLVEWMNKEENEMVKSIMGASDEEKEKSPPKKKNALPTLGNL